LIFAERLRAHGVVVTHIDSRQVIVTDDRHTLAAPLFGPTNENLQKMVVPATKQGMVVMGGFIASTAKGVTSTLGRGGSDYSAAIIGAGIDADEIQIWTDVDGMLTADPTVMKGGHRLKACSFSEAAEMAYFGAKVLHPATVLPAIEKNIPVRILNSRRPEVEGTVITTTAPTSKNVVKSIASKKDVTVLDVTSSRMVNAYGFLSRIFEIFNRLETPVDMLATSEVSVSLTIDNTSRLDEIQAELREFAEVELRPGQAIVCIVGEGIKQTPGVAARAFGAISDVNIQMISQGASLLNLGMVVSMDDLPRAVRQLHEEFFAEVDTEVFEPSNV
jgi:aspartate kinase